MVISDASLENASGECLWWMRFTVTGVTPTHPAVAPCRIPSPASAMIPFLNPIRIERNVVQETAGRDLTLQWRNNEWDRVSHHQPHHCLLNRLFRRKSEKTSKLRVTGLCAGNSSVTGEFPAQMASNAETVSTWWRHHDTRSRIQDAGRQMRQVNTVPFLPFYHCCTIKSWCPWKFVFRVNTYDTKFDLICVLLLLSSMWKLPQDAQTNSIWCANVHCFKPTYVRMQIKLR